MRQACWALVGVLLLTAPGAASAQTVDAGRGELPVHVPSSYSAAAPAPLIVLLHGYTSSGAGQDTYMQVSALKDAYGFILVAPDGTREDSGNRPRFWNASAACCNFAGSTVDDVAYLTGLIDAVKADYAVDDKRVYLFGHSNGGFMAYRMAHEHGDAIAAIASLAGADQSRPRPEPPEPVHVLQIHGTADTAIPYEGGGFRDEPVPGRQGQRRELGRAQRLRPDGRRQRRPRPRQRPRRSRHRRQPLYRRLPARRVGRAVDHQRRGARAGPLRPVHPPGRRVAAGASEAVTTDRRKRPRPGGGTAPRRFGRRCRPRSTRARPGHRLRASHYGATNEGANGGPPRGRYPRSRGTSPSRRRSSGSRSRSRASKKPMRGTGNTESDWLCNAHPTRDSTGRRT